MAIRPAQFKVRAVLKVFEGTFSGEHYTLLSEVQFSNIPRLKCHFQTNINHFHLNFVDAKTRAKIDLCSKGVFNTNQPLCMAAFQGNYCLMKK